MAAVLSIASPGNESGKTRLAATILEAFPGRFAAMKVTTVYRDGLGCPKTETSCACRELHGAYTIIEDPEVIRRKGTDTERLARAGASRVVWALSKPSAHALLWKHATEEIFAAREPMLTEGNKIVAVCEPRLLVVVVRAETPRDRWKPDTWPLLERADLVVVNAREGEGASSRTPASAARELAREIRGRSRAPVLVQDVAVALRAWRDPSLLRWTAALLEAGAPAAAADRASPRA